MNPEEWGEDCPQILFGLMCLKRLCKAPQGYVEKLLDNLIADDPFSGGNSPTDQFGGAKGFRRCGAIEGVDEDIGVEKEPGVLILHFLHSFRRG